MSGTLSTWTASDRDKGQAANAVVLPRKMLAPNTAKLHPSPWNVNTTELENHMAHMKKFTIPEHILRHIGGFVRSPLTQQQLAERLPCFNCFNSVIKSEECICHTGRINNHERWTCCGRFRYAPGCRAVKQHQPYANWMNENEFHHTPATPGSYARSAVAMDCEMGHSRASRNDLIRVTMIDYITEEILLDALVFPKAEMVDFNTKYSGVTRAMMENARRQGTCILGSDKARETVLRFIAPTTVVIGHAVQNDFNALRWIHPIVVDSLVIEQRVLKALLGPVEPKPRVPKEMKVPKEKGDKTSQPCKKKKGPPKPKGGGPMSLKTVCMARLGQKIQDGTDGHDSLEDARAASDIVKWHVQNGTTIEWEVSEW